MAQTPWQPVTPAQEAAVRARLAAVRGFLLDLDGTFYLGDRLLDGSLDFLETLRRIGRSALFLTNNSSRSGAAYVDKLRRLGVTAPFLQVLTSGQAAGRYVLRRFGTQPGYLLGTPALREELRAMGVALSEQQPAYVLLAFDTALTYAGLTRVCDLVRAGLPYIATHPDFNCPTEGGFIPDIGATIAYVHASTGRRPDVVIGKPNAGIAEEAQRLLGLPREQLAMVGDRLYTDIATGICCGMTSILVLTGEATAAEAAASEWKPDLTFDRLASMNAYL